MAENRRTGKLAVILHADIAGSTVLVQQDEQLAHERIQDTFQRFSETIEKYHGRVRELRGDALLAEFERASDGVTAALIFQAEHTENITHLKDNIQPVMRAGISLGEVIIADNTVTGTGVVLAQRVEQLAEPGGLCITAAIHEALPQRLPYDQENLGEQPIKGFDEPVRVYKVSLRAGAKMPDPESPPRAGVSAISVPDKPSIAVLPFDNMSGDSEQEYFADGISEDLITALSKIRWFFVIARNSTFTYKGQSVEITRVAEELGVRYVIEGSVRKVSNRVRISAQLIDATTGHHVWAERYDRSLADIFELQDEMTQTIVGAVEPELSAAERERAAHAPPESLDAWEIYQKGLWHLWRFSRDDMSKARRLFRKVQNLDSGFASAYAFESYSHYLDAMLGFTDMPDKSIDTALNTAKKALSLDDKDPVAYFALGRAYMLRGKHNASVAELHKAVALSPSFALAHHGLGFALVLSGRLEEGAEELDKAMRLSPRDPVLWGTMCFRSIACNLLGQFQDAVNWAQKAVHEPRSADGGYWSYAVLASALGNLGNTEEARKAMGNAMQRKPDLSINYLNKTLPTKQEDGLLIYLNGLRKAGLPE